MTHARQLTWFLLLAIASVDAGCQTHGESPATARKDPNSKDPTPGFSPRVAACPGAAREETHTLATLHCYE